MANYSPPSALVQPGPASDGTSAESVARRKFVAGLRAVALFEAFKGLIVILAGFGAWSLAHHDLRAMAGRLIQFAHLDPASDSVRSALNLVGQITDGHLRLITLAAFLYAAIRGIEAYGLWRQRGWAEWFALVSTSLYIPFEVYEIVHRATLLTIVVFAVNATIVVFLAIGLVNFSPVGTRPASWSISHWR